MLRSYFKCEAKILLSAKSCLLFFLKKKFKNRFQNSQLFIVRMKNDVNGESKMLSWTLKIGVTSFCKRKIVFSSDILRAKTQIMHTFKRAFIMQAIQRQHLSDVTHLPLFFRENEAHIHLVTKLVVSSTQKLGYKASYDTLKKHLTLNTHFSSKPEI